MEDEVKIDKYLLYSSKVDKISGFFHGAVNLGYNFDDAWDLLLNYDGGRKLLNNDLYYCIHQEGRVTAEYADKELGNNYVKCHKIKFDKWYFDLLAEFIEFVHTEYNLEYDKIFTRITIGEFYDKYHIVLGNYDSKLAEAYILPIKD